VNGEANGFVRDIFSSGAALNRELVNNRKVLIGLSKEVKYGRKIWGMLCLELWQQEFHDKEYFYKQLINGEGGLQ
jgi:asparagine synthase (glutamine-hydrolysing)